ncbi:MAG: sigma-70 family RNA polymerase sigma factor [Demequinaceae bacterium]|nr:sigma-70 family RNA polymerase sigma factor [Demequinaceae bacterium]
MAWEPMLYELDRARRGRLLSFAIALAGWDAAEDLVQEAVVATFSRHRGFESVAQAEHYVRRAIASKYIDSQRRAISTRRSERSASLAEAVPDRSEAVATGDAVSRALASLPPRVRACVALRYIEDLSVRDTATTLGLSEGAVKRYVSDGIAHLNATLGTKDAAVLEDVSVVTTKEARR